MKTVRAAALLCLLLAGLATGAHAATGTCESLPGGPVELESTGGLIGPTGYASLGAAFADINNGSYTGAITIDVCGDAAEGVSAVLNASGVGGSSYTGVTISPAGGAAHTISGSIAGALVDLSGADGVVIDGLNASGNSLTLDNSSTGPASTIRFIGEATGNSIQNCTIKGSSTSVTSGTIVFATGASTGNNSNTINGNLITPSGANLPANAIYSAGTSAGIANTGIAITNNFVSDWFSATTASNGILVASNSAAWTITGNRFFQSATRTATTGATHRAIGIVTASGGGYTVGNNTIGFANGSGGGITTYTGAVAILYRGIEMTVAASPASSVQGNTVSGISLSTTSNSSTAPGVFAGISILGGSVNVGTSTGNTVGSSSATGAITVTSTVTGSLTDGIYATTGAAAGTLDIRNNSVGGITASSATAAIGFVVRGIETAGTGGVVTISGNTIGSTTAADSIQIGINGTTTAVTSFAGIQNAATGTPHSISNNTVQNCSANGSGASIFQGIINAGGSSTATVSGNSVIAGTLRGTGASQGIVNIAPVPTINLTSNTVRGMTLTAATGTFQGVANQGASTVAINIDDNKLGDANGGFISYAAATSGALIGIANTAGGTAGPALSIQRNDVRGISHAVTASHANDYINVSAGTFISQTIKDNTFTNISVNTTGTTTMIRVGAAVGISTPSTPGTRTVANNSIVGTFTKTGAGGSVIGFFINAGSALTSSTDNVASNNFSNVTLTGATTATCISDQENATRTIQNNTCSNWSGANGASLQMTGINVNGFSGGGGATVSGNTISNVTVATAIVGIQINGNASPTTVSSNILSGLTATNNGGVTGITGGTPGTGTNTVSINSNSISGLSSASTTGSGSVTGVNAGGSIGSGLTNATVSGNVVKSLSSSFSGAAVTGVVVGNLVNPGDVSRNRIYDVALSAAAGSVTGLSAGGNNASFSNNLIGDLRAPSAVSGTTPTVAGLAPNNLAGGLSLSHNTVYVAGTSSGSPFSTTALFMPAGPTITLRNNVLVNASTPTGSGMAVALWRNSASLTGYDATSNNNDFVAPTVYFDGTTAFPTMGGFWSAVSPRETASFSENPPFVSTLGTDPGFLHITPGSNTQIESGGATGTGITDDFDGDVRGASPDVGADEFAGTNLDLTAPAVAYTFLGREALPPVTSRSFTATATDRTGVETGTGIRPRVYYKKLTDPNDATGWKYTEATGAGSPFTFTIDYTLLSAGGVSSGDVIQYFVVAQDTAATPNVGIYQGAFAAPPSSVALTSAAFPIGGTINSYLVPTPLSGTNTVCPSGCTYTSLTNAGGLFATINANVVTGNYVVEITGDSTAETGANALGEWLENPPASNYTLMIRPSGGAVRTVSGSVAGSLIRLNGADRVTIDGLNTGGNGLTVSNTSTANPSSTLTLTSLGASAGATNDAIKNLTIAGGANTAGIYGINLSGAALNQVGPDSDNVTIQGNTITKVSEAIYAFGGNSPNMNDGLAISGNTVGPVAAGADSIGLHGIFIQNATSPTISGNVVRNLTATATNAGGIWVNSTVTGGSVTNNTITNMTSTIAATGSSSIAGIFLGSNVINVTVSGNRIQTVFNTTATTGARGITLNPGSGVGNITIVNNTIADVFSNMNNFNAAWPFGISLDSGINHKVYSNSVNLFGAHPGTAATGGSAALFIGSSAVTGLDIRNNVFSNSYDTTSLADQAFAIYSLGAATAFTAIDFNDYYVSGTGTPLVGHLGTAVVANDKLTLADWKNATGKDVASIAANPQFVSTTDLHIDTTGAATPIENTGVVIAGVGNDVDGDLRNATTPDIGADEVRCHATIVAESCNDGSLCSVDSCNPTDGACNYVAGNAGATCRASAGSCDLAETCDGSNTACPADALVPAAVECRASTGACDPAETCTGASASCPGDALASAGTECRGSAGVCDVAETCDGSTATCPADVFVAGGNECRASAGACDPSETCTGVSALCPGDALASAGTECRGAAGVCDVAESCDGATAACPADAKLTSECRGSAGVCDVAESCDGVGNDCPSDAFEASTTECRASTAACDPAETCSGISAACPADVVNGATPVGDSLALAKSGVTTTITWSADPAGPYSVYRGARVSSLPWAYNQGCFQDGLATPSVTDSQSPLGTQLYYYLVTRSEGSCGESSLGQATAGERPNNAACPSPGNDTDNDGVLDQADNCPTVANMTQADVDGDLVGDDCDNCPAVANGNQHDTDGDAQGDACDADLDGDGVPNATDNCPSTPNADQLDANENGIGDACE